MKKILIVNPFGIGDVLFSTPMIGVLKERFPESSISYLGNTRTVPILKNDPRINKVFCYERDEFVAVYKKSPWQFFLKWRKLVEEIRLEKFDVSFDLSMGPPLGLALVLAGIPERIGFNYKGRGRWLTHSTILTGFEGKHVSEYFLDLLNHLTGNRSHLGEPRELSMSFFTSQDDERWAENFLKTNNINSTYLVCVYPGGGASWGAQGAVRRWPAENYVHLANKIVKNSNAVIILMGDKADVALCQSVAEKMSHAPLIAAGQTTLGQSAALMKRCHFVVLNDGGAMHVAAALGVRTLVVFGPVDPQVYGPIPKSKHKSIIKGLPCQPCYRNFRMSDCKHQLCLKELSVDDVWQEVLASGVLG